MSSPEPAGGRQPLAHPAAAASWWEPRGHLDRFLADLLFAEVQALRPGGPWPALGDFTPGAALGETGLGLDSLEHLALAAALEEAVLLHRAGVTDALVTGQRLGDWRDATCAALARFSATVRFRSSGSSGPRRSSAHALEDLSNEIAFFASHWPQTRRVVAAVPSHHIYGFLFTLMLPAHLGVPVADIRGSFPGSVAGSLRAGDLVIGHPGFWASLCRAVPDGWPPGVIGVSSGAPCPPDTAQATVQAGLASLVQIYGSSETSGIGWRSDPASPYQLLPCWQPLDDGKLMHRARAIPVEAPDHLRWHGSRGFTLEGRRDSAVQVGGINAYPERVRAVLRELPGVADAAVRLMEPGEGDRLKAFIVPRDAGVAHAELRRDLARHAEARLRTAERPRAFSFGAALPFTVAGKPDNWSIDYAET